MNIPLYGKEVSLPIGKLLLLANDHALVGIVWEKLRVDEQYSAQSNPIIERTHAQLNEYFAGRRVNFDLQVTCGGTALQQAVWKALQDIPFGITVSYAELAQRIGNPTAVRAVASAVGKNPIPIILPCHRVIGSDGRLRGFAGGLPAKKMLLELEAVQR